MKSEQDEELLLEISKSSNCCFCYTFLKSIFFRKKI